ncbi:GntR family transcriptional regulator [Rhodobacter sp. KR11]|uniref:GntR family transcriptional regulator n=1 Tax=Rhodobacter sp. KR11 TaxID=2974588 RepID=UPI00222287DE|nr:GntR family transcriptional regulator [Rhodobacter sp. KR11]MCW1919988.1 GntR family transcriptional regulator [Rhodobacter sp. KR11]
MESDLKIEAPARLRDVVLERLRGAIVAGRFASGERLIERNLCDLLGVSRSVVREVIRILEAEGLVEEGTRGPMVARLDWGQARQIYDIRVMLEAHAARECAGRADDMVRADVRAALAGIGGEGALDATARFYEVIFKAAGHDIAWEIVQRLNGRISRLRALTLASSDRKVSGLVRMTRIAEAVIAGDGAGAEAAVRAHLTEAAAIARRILEA